MTGPARMEGRRPCRHKAVMQDAYEISREILGIHPDHGWDVDGTALEFYGSIPPSTRQLARLEKHGIRLESYGHNGTVACLRLEVDIREFRLTDRFFEYATDLPRWMRPRIIDAAPGLISIISRPDGHGILKIFLSFGGGRSIQRARAGLSRIGIEVGECVDTNIGYHTYGATYHAARAAKAAGMCAIEAPA